jgi:hypothetical protein
MTSKNREAGEMRGKRAYNSLRHTKFQQGFFDREKRSSEITSGWIFGEYRGPYQPPDSTLLKNRISTELELLQNFQFFH